MAVRQLVVLPNVNGVCTSFAAQPKTAGCEEPYQSWAAANLKSLHGLNTNR